MIQFVVSDQRQGGVFDFTNTLRNSLPEPTLLVHLTKENISRWNIANNDIIILQLSAYGFDRRGIPIWLARNIAARRKCMGKFGVFFHELYAFGPPWRSSFWLSPIQRLICRNLVQSCDFWMTNRDESADWLSRYGAEKPHATLPVFSSMGESSSASSARRRSVVVFGSASVRAASYRAVGNELFQWANRESLTIDDVGPDILDAEIRGRLHANQVRIHGRLEASQVGEVLADARYGLLAYPVEYVAKSSIFAAYCAHAVCPILISPRLGQSDGLFAFKHYLPSIPVGQNPIDRALDIGKAAWAWYQAHTVYRHADAIRFFVGNPIGREL